MGYAIQYDDSIAVVVWRRSKAVAPEVQDAFDRTWPVIQRAIAAQPPKIEINSPIVDEIYNNNRTLRLAYIQQGLYRSSV